MNRFLWVVQIVLALLFLFTGVSKLMMSLLKTAVWLTPLAAALLVIIMNGATVDTLPAGPLGALPLVTGVLCVVVRGDAGASPGEKLSSWA
ncbi:MAG TPA: hypothetical protein VGM43_13430 [Bryobacteraceae bacterium]